MLPVRTVHLIAAARPNFMKVAPLWHALKASGRLSRRSSSIPASIMTPTCRPPSCRPRPARARFPPRHRLGQPCRADRPGDDRLWRGRRGAPARLAGRGRRRQFDGRLRPGRHQARHPHRPSRGGPALARPAHARGAEPARHRRALRRAVDALARRRPQPARRRHSGRADQPGRQHHARQLRDEPRRRSRRRTCPTRWGWTRGGYAVVTLHRPSNVDDPEQLRAPRRGARSGPGAAADRLPGPSAHRRAARRGRARPGARGGRRAADRAGALYRLHEPGARRRRGDHRFGRPAGRDHLSRHPLLHPAREYRAADHHRGGHQRAGDARRALPACSTRRWPAATPGRAGPNIGTAAPPGAASRT